MTFVIHSLNMKIYPVPTANIIIIPIHVFQSSDEDEFDYRGPVLGYDRWRVGPKPAKPSAGQGRWPKKKVSASLFIFLIAPGPAIIVADSKKLRSTQFPGLQSPVHVVSLYKFHNACGLVKSL